MKTPLLFSNRSQRALRAVDNRQANRWRALCLFDGCDESELVQIGQLVNIKISSFSLGLYSSYSTLDGILSDYVAVTQGTVIHAAVMSESLSTKMRVSRGSLPHWVDPKEPPSKRAPYSTILGQPFNHTVF